MCTPLARRGQSSVMTGELVFYAMFNHSWLYTYGGQFPQLEKQIIPGSEPATFR